MNRACRLIVLVGAVLAALVLTAELAAGASLFAALAKSGAAGVGTMAAAGMGLRLWAGAIVESVQLPGGAGVQLERNDEIDAVRDDLRRLSLKTDGRLRRLERKVLEENGRGGSIN